MSSPRVQRLFEAMPNQIRLLLAEDFDWRSSIRWQGSVTAGAHAGRTAMLLDLDSATWADNNRRAIVIAEPAGADAGDAMRTQSHAAGMFMDTSVRFHVYVETPEAWSDAQARFVQELAHHLRGQLGSPVKFWYGTNDVEPTVEGVNGAGATSAFTAGAWQVPAGVSGPGGV